MSGPLACSRQRAIFFPPKRCSSPRAQCAMASGVCSSVEFSLFAVAQSQRQRACFLARPIQTDEGGKVALARCYPIQLGLIHFKCWVVFCFSGRSKHGWLSFGEGII